MIFNFECGCRLHIWHHKQFQSALSCCVLHEAPSQKVQNILRRCPMVLVSVSSHRDEVGKYASEPLLPKCDHRFRDGRCQDCGLTLRSAIDEELSSPDPLFAVDRRSSDFRAGVRFTQAVLKGRPRELAADDYEAVARELVRLDLLAADLAARGEAVVGGGEIAPAVRERVSYAAVLGRHAAQADMTWPQMPLCPARDSMREDAAALRELAKLVERAVELDAIDDWPENWVGRASPLIRALAAGYEGPTHE